MDLRVMWLFMKLEWADVSVGMFKPSAAYKLSQTSDPV